MSKLAALLALALAAAALAACGDDNGTTTTETETGGEAANGAAAGGAAGAGGKGGATLEFKADPGGELAYTTEKATAEAGKVMIDFTNPQTITHDVAIEAPDGELVGKTDIITESSATTTVDLKPGEYTFYCTVPGHREAGMEGTLAVK